MSYPQPEAKHLDGTLYGEEHREADVEVLQPVFELLRLFVDLIVWWMWYMVREGFISLF